MLPENLLVDSMLVESMVTHWSETDAVVVR